MKKIVVLLVLICFVLIPELNAQNKFSGNWMGKLNVQGMSLRLIFNISEYTDGGLKGIMKSPDQTTKEFVVDTIISEGDSIKLVLKLFMGHFDGMYKNDTTISGKWFQGNMSIPLELIRTDNFALAERPQNPKKPYPYKEEEIVFPNKSAGITLAGTLTYPDRGNKFPAIILITGSGPQDRDETVFRHKPFLIIADYLTRNGFAVLRFDDRGIGKSTGNFASATSLDFVSDVLSALDYLKSRGEIDVKKIGLIGHSEGGMIAPIVASQTNDVGFIVLMAGPGLTGKEILLKQTQLIMKAEGMDSAQIERSVSLNKKCYEIAITEKDSAAAFKKLSVLMDQYYESLPDSIKVDPGNSKEALYRGISPILSPWFKYFLAYNPASYLEHLKIPLLALNGENDLQVPADEDLDAINKYLKRGKNKNYKTIKFPHLNHLFQTSTTGAPSEYAIIDETIAPVVLQTIGDWLKKQTKR